MASDAPDPPPALRRGDGVSGKTGSTFHLWFVRAPIEAVGEVYARLSGATAWHRDAYGHRFPSGAGCALLAQLKGHSWTQVTNLRGRCDPLRVSRLLKTEVVSFFYEKVSSTTGFEVIDRGVLVESFECSPDGGTFFRSDTRGDGVNAGEDPFAFIDETFKALDLYAFFLPVGPTNERDGEGRVVYEVTDPAPQPAGDGGADIRREDFERVDLIRPPDAPAAPAQRRERDGASTAHLPPTRPDGTPSTEP